jgi:hypothetical protein
MNFKPESIGMAMNNRVSVLYTYRNPWPRRLAIAAAVLLLLGASKLVTAQMGADAPQHGCAAKR